MNEIQVVEAPLEKGVTAKEVRAALAAKFPSFRIASLIRDREDEVWRAKLVKEAEFPPSDDEGGDEEEAEEKPKKKPKFESDDSDDDSDDSDEDSDDEGGDEHEHGLDDEGDVKGDPKMKAEHLIKQLEHLLPQLQHLLNGGIGDMGEDVGPHMSPDAPVPPGGHLAPPPPGAGPDGAAPTIPHHPPRPGVPGGRPPGAMGPTGIPTFTKRRTQLLEREANVTAREAREELETEFPEYDVTELKKHKTKFLAKLELKAR